MAQTDMTNIKVRNINQIMLRDLRNSIQAGLCTSNNTNISKPVLERLARLTDQQIELIANKISIGLCTPLSVSDKEQSVFWEDMVYFCEVNDDEELDDMIDKLVRVVRHS